MDKQIERIKKNIEKLITEDGYMKCSRCDGDGFIKTKDWNLIRCPKCEGMGLIDWVQNITGITK